MAFSNSMLMDPDNFNNLETFQYDRFVDPSKKSAKETLLTSQLRPFDGGIRVCALAASLLGTTHGLC
jgi:cytochrome P450